MNKIRTPGNPDKAKGIIGIHHNDSLDEMIGALFVGSSLYQVSEESVKGYSCFSCRHEIEDNRSGVVIIRHWKDGHSKMGLCHKCYNFALDSASN